MITFLTLLFFITLAGISFIRPRFGLVMIWITSWLYPNTLLSGTLPLNVRFDDLWVVYMFLLSLFVAHRTTGLGIVPWLAMLWMLTNVTGNLAGLLMSGGGQWELGPGRGHIQYLAALFHAEAPNDVAPGGYNAERPTPGLPASPLDLRPAPTGFRWSTD